MSDHARARSLGAVGAVANLLTVAWVSVAVAVSRRGLGAGNEGFYLLAFRHWNEDRRTFTGMQYLYGPVFDLLDQDIGALRLVRLASVLVVHIVLGVAFARWLRLHRPTAPPSRAWEYAIASMVVASGAILYGWLPLTPGYNDVTMLGSELLVALLLVSLRAVHAGGPAPRWAAFVTGVVVGGMVLAKPPVALPLVLVVATSAYALRLAGGGLWRLALPVVAGAAVFAAAIQLFVAPWSEIVPPMREQISVVSGSTHSPLEVVSWYVESSLTVLKTTLLVCAPTALAVLVARRLRTTSPGRRAVIGLVGLAASMALLAGAGGLRAGAANVLAFASGMVGLLVIVVACTVRRPRGRPRRPSPEVVVLGLLAFVPVLQGFGTNNALYAVAVNGAALWVALMVALVTSHPWTVGTRTVVASTATALSVLLAVVVGLDGLTHEAGGRSVVTGPMGHVSGSSELASITLPAAEATELSRLRTDLGIAPGTHRPMLALGQLGQYVLILGGRPIGDAWYSTEDDGINGADLRAACRHGNPWGTEQPLVVAQRDPSSDELAAWRACGIDFAHDYADVTPPSAPAGVKILRWQPGAGTTTPTPAGDSSATG